DWRMIGRLLHATQFVVDASVLESLAQAQRGEYQVDAQAALGLVLKAAAAVIEPAEAVVHLGVQVAEAVHQTPALQTLQPLALFRQEAAFAGAQPALGILGTDADVAILG